MPVLDLLELNNNGVDGMKNGNRDDSSEEWSKRESDSEVEVISTG